MSLRKTLIPMLAAAALMAAPAAAEAHAYLSKSVPPAGSTVAHAPSVLTMRFTERMEPHFSGATVENAAGKRVDRGSSVRGIIMRVRLKHLRAGTYHVHWHALSVDTHKTHGSFSFTVK